MGVTLKLQDGTIKEYPLGRNAVAKCRTAGCGHVECAIDDRVSRGRGMRMAIYLLPLGTLITLAVIYLFVLSPSTVVLSFAVAGIVVILDLACIVMLGQVARKLDNEARELREFRDRKTVNGIPAVQVPETPPAP